MKQIYSSSRRFKIWAYTVSHSFLLLRSEIVFDENENPIPAFSSNIDIEFVTLQYIELPQNFVGIEIHEVDSYPQRVEKYLQFEGLKVFQIYSEGSSFYIVASSILIGANKWENMDRFSHNNLEYDEVLASS